MMTVPLGPTSVMTVSLTAVGASLVPSIAIVTVCGVEAPWLSATITE